jgi:hypothetical protein
MKFKYPKLTIFQFQIVADKTIKTMFTRVRPSNPLGQAACGPVRSYKGTDRSPTQRGWVRPQAFETC